MVATIKEWPADKIERRAVDSLIPYARNSRTHSDEQVAQIAASIKEWGWTTPILVSEDGTIIAGHGRVMAARKLGIKDAPVIVARGWSEAQIRAYVIADNKLALNAGWDNAMLEAELKGLGELGFDLGLTGFSDLELGALTADKTAGLTDPDEVPPPPADPVSQKGDLWILDNHRLLCGDSTDAAAVERLLAGVKPRLMVTDPPYGIGYAYDKHDDRNSAANADLVYQVFALAPAGKVWTPGLMNLARDVGRFGKAKVLAWHKGFAAAGNGIGGASTWEPVLVVDPPRKALKDDYLPFKTDRASVNGQSLRELHPCPKPAALFAHLIEAFTSPHQAIYEPFCGSGTTMIAAEMEGRHAYCMELSEAYVDVIVKRWQAFTGQSATLEATGETFDEIKNKRAAKAAA